MAITITADTLAELRELVTALRIPGVEKYDVPEGNIEILPSLTAQVRLFHAKFGFVDRLDDGPVEPELLPPNEIGWRLSILAREFVEVVAAFGVDTEWGDMMRRAISFAHRDGKFGQAKLSEIAHELADLDYAAEGVRVTLGIPRTPIAVAVHTSNMAKELDHNQELVKPKGWMSPAQTIQRLLQREQDAAVLRNNHE